MLANRKRINYLISIGHHNQESIIAIRSHFLNGSKENVALQKPLVSLGNITKRDWMEMQDGILNRSVTSAEPLTS